MNCLEDDEKMILNEICTFRVGLTAYPYSKPEDLIIHVELLYQPFDDEIVTKKDKIDDNSGMKIIDE